MVFQHSKILSRKLSSGAHHHSTGMCRDPMLYPQLFPNPMVGRTTSAAQCSSPQLSSPGSSRNPEEGHGPLGTLGPHSNTPAPNINGAHGPRRQRGSTTSNRSSTSGEGRDNHHPEPHSPTGQKTAGSFLFFFKLLTNTLIQGLGELGNCPRRVPAPV